MGTFLDSTAKNSVVKSNIDLLQSNEKTVKTQEKTHTKKNSGKGEDRLVRAASCES